MAKLDHARRIVKYEIMGLALLILSLITLGDLGTVGQALDDLCIELAGNWHFLIPIYLIWVALYIMIRRNRFRYSAIQVGIALIGFIIVTWSELTLFQQAVILYQGNLHPPLLSLTRQGIQSLTQSLHVELVSNTGVIPPASAGGGMIGFALFTGLQYLFSVTGTLLVLLGVSLVAVVLITKKSMVGTIEKGAKFFERHLDKGWARGVLLFKQATATRKRHSAMGIRQNVTRKRRSMRKEGHDSENENSLSGIDESSINDGEEFPFPDFVVPKQEHAEFEYFVTDGTQVELDSFSQPAEPELLSKEEPPVVTLDPDHSRMTARYKRKEFTPLQADPVEMITPEHRYDEQQMDSGSLPREGVATRPYRLPDLRLLDRSTQRKGDTSALQRDLQMNAKKLADTFESFGVQVKVLGFSRGPTVTRYEIQPAVGVKVSRILSLSDDLALALAARDIRIEAPIPGKSAVGIEVPNKEIAVVTFREVLETETFAKAISPLSFALGKDIAGNTILGDLAKMPHVLVAGATGSGKSVCINGIIASILFRAKPDEVKFIMIDPKMVELGVYNDIPHLFAPVVTDARRAAAALRKVVAEMEHRYELFHKAKVRDLERYNLYAAKEGKPVLPLMVVIIDELADLMMVAPGDVEDAICRLAQMARAAGIHLVIATQRPSVDVITGLIKANVPSRIAFSVSSGVDSRTILDSSGAEKLLGRGDMLYLPVGASKPIRLQGAYLSETEIEKLVDFIKNQQGASYQEDFSLVDEKTARTDNLDPLFEEAVKLVVESEQASVSYLQRRLKVGYSRAARLVDSLEELGIVGPFENSKPREVLMTREEWLQRSDSL